MTALLELDGVALQAGARTLVEQLSLRIEPGERWAVLGPNGAGKSTLLVTIAGARRADAGIVRLGGVAVEASSELELARRRALVVDRWIDPFASSVVETVMTARYRMPRDEPSAAHARALGLLQMMDCAALGDRDVRQLSRGERQRVAIATALAQETPLLLLDEPTAHQDPRHQALVVEKLRTLAGTALIASLHDINAAVRFATHALLLTGQSRYVAGLAADVLNDEALSALFETRISSVQTDEGRWFRVHAAGY